MPCRVGITTDPDARRAYWDGRVAGLRDWRIVSTHHSKSAAQQAEANYSVRTGCVSFPGGSGPARATWFVYRFTYTRDMG